MTTIIHVSRIITFLGGLVLLSCLNLLTSRGESAFRPAAVEVASILDNIESGDLVYAPGSGKEIITNTLTISDKDSKNIRSASVRIINGYNNAEDVLSFTNQNKIAGVWNKTTGVLSLTGSSSLANYQNALRSIQYENTNALNPSTTTRTVSFRVNDGADNSNTVSRNIAIVMASKAPRLANIEAFPIVYCVNSGGITVTSTLAVSDDDNINLKSANVRITTGYAQGNVLRFASQNGITGSWDDLTGTMTLTGEATVANYQSALRSIQYENNNAPNPDDGLHEVTFIVNDGQNSSNSVTRSIFVNGLVSCILTGSAEICSDQETTAPLRIDFSGTAPWSFTLMRNNGNETKYNNISQNPYIINVGLDGTYRIKSVSDANCTGDTAGSGYARVTFNERPAASISGISSICEDSSADLGIVLTGNPPWKFSYKRDDQAPVVVENVMSGPWTLTVRDTGTYTLAEVSDKYCQGTVSGSAVVTLSSAPEVTISGLAAAYDKEDTRLIPITGTPAGGVFSGQGLFFSDPNWYFLPRYAPVGTFDIVYAYQETPGSCFGYDTAIVRVLEASAVIYFPDDRTNYCQNEAPFTITAANVVNSIGSFTISGGAGLTDNHDNTATITPSLLDDEKEYTITYTYFDEMTLSITGKFDVRTPPLVDFQWESECYMPGQSIKFNNTSTTSFGTITASSWKIYNNSGYDTATTHDIVYSFQESGSHNIELQIRTSYGCTGKIIRPFVLKPYIHLADLPYSEDFESATQNWQSRASTSLAANSWMLGDPSNDFSGASPGNHCWYTHIPDSGSTIEQSWVSSPCFDFTGTKRPLLKLNIWRFFNSNRDGANLQFTADSGKTWTLLGKIGDGINWFNHFNILGYPGEKAIGWSNLHDENWHEARHSLDMLTGKKIVQLRIAYGTDGTALNNHGIAFDNIWIGRQNRTALLEHFTNASDDRSKDADFALNNLAQNDSLSIIDLQYHTSFPGKDPFNEQEPYIPGARVLYYGLPYVPYTILNGGSRPSQRFDYDASLLNEDTVHIESLRESKFNINIINSKIDGNTLNIETQVVAKEEIPSGEFTVHVAIIERQISGVTGNNGETDFRNVVKTLLPDAAGTPLYQSWIKDESKTILNSWEMQHVYDTSQLRVVSFIQDESTGEIYQAIMTSIGVPSGTTDVKPIRGFSNSFLVFPNPASDRVMVRFEKPLAVHVRIEMFNNLGSMVYSGGMFWGASETEIPTGDFPPGIYTIRAIAPDQVLGFRKLTIVR
jgi:hypothetical protein